MNIGTSQFRFQEPMILYEDSPVAHQMDMRTGSGLSDLVVHCLNSGAVMYKCHSDMVYMHATLRESRDIGATPPATHARAEDSVGMPPAAHPPSQFHHQRHLSRVRDQANLEMAAESNASDPFELREYTLLDLLEACRPSRACLHRTRSREGA